MSHDQLPVIALSVGEPAGIGPDIAAQIATHEIPARLFCIADPKIIAARADLLGIALELLPYPSPNAVERHRPGSLAILPTSAEVAVTAGRLDPRNATYVLRCLDLAIASARSGDVDAIVTGPVHKGVINDAGYDFTGHTEYLKHDGDPQIEPVMMLACDGLRVALVTTHMPLSAVSQALSEDSVFHVINVVGVALERQFNIAKPRIAVCGVNPHAGESGHFGREDIEIIAPAITRARDRGLDVIGPLPADTAFAPTLRATFDAHITMYHDQGLPVIKALGFGEIVNITLGLPILRTSVDHGTALDIAGTGNARSDSLLAAIAAAISLAGRSNN